MGCRIGPYHFEVYIRSMLLELYLFMGPQYWLVLRPCAKDISWGCTQVYTSERVQAAHPRTGSHTPVERFQTVGRDSTSRSTRSVGEIIRPPTRCLGLSAACGLTSVGSGSICDLVLYYRVVRCCHHPYHHHRNPRPASSPRVHTHHCCKCCLRRRTGRLQAKCCGPPSGR